MADDDSQGFELGELRAHGVDGLVDVSGDVGGADPSATPSASINRSVSGAFGAVAAAAAVVRRVAGFGALRSISGSRALPPPDELSARAISCAARAPAS